MSLTIKKRLGAVTRNTDTGNRPGARARNMDTRNRPGLRSRSMEPRGAAWSTASSWNMVAAEEHVCSTGMWSEKEHH